MSSNDPFERSQQTDEWLELELLDGLEGDDVPMDRKDWDDIEREALEILRARKNR